jgi:hypothetical protein
MLNYIIDLKDFFVFVGSIHHRRDGETAGEWGRCGGGYGHGGSGIGEAGR